jgi:hypothetical protein
MGQFPTADDTIMEMVDTFCKENEAREARDAEPDAAKEQTLRLVDGGKRREEDH